MSVHVEVFWKPEMSDVARSIMAVDELKHKLDELNAAGVIPPDAKKVSLFIESESHRRDGQVFIRIFFDEVDPMPGELMGFYVKKVVR